MWFTLNVLSPRKKKLELELKVLLLQHLIKKFMWKFGFKYETWKCVGSFSKFQYWCHEKEKTMFALNGKIILGSCNIWTMTMAMFAISNLFRLYVCTLNHFICFHFFNFSNHFSCYNLNTLLYVFLCFHFLILTFVCNWFGLLFINYKTLFT